MKLVLVTLVVFSVATTLSHDNDEETGCVFENGDKVKVGEEYYKHKGCMRIRCEGPGKFSGVGCVSNPPAPDRVCNIKEDKGQPWPDCCPRYVNCKPEL